MALDSDIHHISLIICLKFWLVFQLLEKHLFQQLNNCKISSLKIKDDSNLFYYFLLTPDNFYLTSDFYYNNDRSLGC